MKRKDVPIEETWDLTLLFPNEEAYESAIKQAKKETEVFIETYKGKIKNSNDLKNALEAYSEIIKNFGQLDSYAYFAQQVEVDNLKTNERLDKLSTLLANLSGKISFFESEIRRLPEEILKDFKDSEYSHYIKKIIDDIPYSLSEESEALLESLKSFMNFPMRIYDSAKLKDTVFPDFQVNGKNYTMDYNYFENHYEIETDTDVRRKAFEVFYQGISKHRNAIAEAYLSEVTGQKAISDFRGYDSVFDYLLSMQEIDREVYDKHIDTILNEFPKYMRKYTKILKKIKGLDEVHYSDLKVDIDPSFSKEISFNEARDIILNGIKPFGDEYVREVKTMFDERRIDYAENEGKSTGAFCSSPYGFGSFIFTIFSNQISETMTLAHELGHCVQGNLAMQNQNILSGDPSMYIIEAPSTASELMVGKSLLSSNDDLKLKRWVLSQELLNTYYHNFITHFLEAVYQREVYRLIDRGDTFNADTLDEIYLKALKDFWGDSIIYDAGCEKTWMRQPHYYMGLYSYTYSAGLTIGTLVALNIEKDPEFAKKWIEVLKAGGSKSPKDLAEIVGIDINKTDGLKTVIAHIGEIIDEIEKISIELGEIK